MTDETTPDTDDHTADTSTGSAEHHDSQPEPRPLPERVRALEQLIAALYRTGEVPPAAGAPPAKEPPAARPGTAVPVEGTEDEDRRGPWMWTHIDADRRQVLAGELVGFVDWLNDRYLRHMSAERFPFSPQWFTCPPAVEILTSVMVAHQSVYSDMQTEPSFALSDWHQHHLWPALARIRELDLFKDGAVTRQKPRTVDRDDDAAMFLTGSAPEPADTAAG